MRKVLITGATGFLGSHLVELLLERGEDELRVLSTSPPEKLSKKDVELVEGLGTDHDLIGRCAKKYLPPEAVEGFLSGPMGQIERIRFVVTPRRWTIWDYSQTPPRGPSPGVYE